jgi:retinoid hydroxylase
MKTLADLPRPVFPEDYSTRVGQFLAECYETHGPIFARNLDGTELVYLVGPEANRFVLLEHRAAFSHDLGWTPIMGEIMGKGLLNMDGAPHDAQRKMMNPAFTQDYMDRYLPIMNRVIDRYVSSWLEQCTVNVYEEARKITFDVAAEALVGFSDQTEIDEFRRLFTQLLMGNGEDTTQEQAFQTAMTTKDTISKMLLEQIEQRRSSPTDDVLGMLVRARDGSGNALSDEQLLGHTNILLVAGHETSTSLSAWLLCLLAQNPEYTARIRAELTAVLGDKDPHLEGVKQLKVLGYALSEAERLYPPVANAPRGTVQDFEFNGYRIPAGTRVIYSIAASHQLPHIWQNPASFDPDRFAPPREEDKKQQFALVGFGGGPRVCIGINFATVEMKAMIAQILRRFDLALEPGFKPYQVYFGATGMPFGGIQLRVTARAS